MYTSQLHNLQTLKKNIETHETTCAATAKLCEDSMIRMIRFSAGFHMFPHLNCAKELQH